MLWFFKNDRFSWWDNVAYPRPEIWFSFMVTLAASILWDHFHQQSDREKQKKMVSCPLTAAALWAESKWQECIWIKVWRCTSFSPNTHPQPHFKDMRMNSHVHKPDSDFHVIHCFNFPGKFSVGEPTQKLHLGILFGRSGSPVKGLKYCFLGSLFFCWSLESPLPALVFRFHSTRPTEFTAPYQGD